MQRFDRRSSKPMSAKSKSKRAAKDQKSVQKGKMTSHWILV
jgi:hypothetical protein